MSGNLKVQWNIVCNCDVAFVWPIKRIIRYEIIDTFGKKIFIRSKIHT